jgi:hypothetical protein
MFEGKAEKDSEGNIRKVRELPQLDIAECSFHVTVDNTTLPRPTITTTLPDPVACETARAATTLGEPCALRSDTMAAAWDSCAQLPGEEPLRWNRRHGAWGCQTASSSDRECGTFSLGETEENQEHCKESFRYECIDAKHSHVHGPAECSKIGDLNGNSLQEFENSHTSPEIQLHFCPAQSFNMLWLYKHPSLLPQRQLNSLSVRCGKVTAATFSNIQAMPQYTNITHGWVRLDLTDSSCSSKAWTFEALQGPSHRFYVTDLLLGHSEDEHQYLPVPADTKMNGYCVIHDRKEGDAWKVGTFEQNEWRTLLNFRPSESIIKRIPLFSTILMQMMFEEARMDWPSKYDERTAMAGEIYKKWEASASPLCRMSVLDGCKPMTTAGVPFNFRCTHASPVTNFIDALPFQPVKSSEEVCGPAKVYGHMEMASAPRYGSKNPWFKGSCMNTYAPCGPNSTHEIDNCTGTKSQQITSTFWSHYSTDIVGIKMDSLMRRTNKTLAMAALHNWNYHHPVVPRSSYNAPLHNPSKSVYIGNGPASLQGVQKDVGITGLVYHCSASFKKGAKQWLTTWPNGNPAQGNYLASDCQHRCGIKGATTFTYWYKPLDASAPCLPLREPVTPAAQSGTGEQQQSSTDTSSVGMETLGSTLGMTCEGATQEWKRLCDTGSRGDTNDIQNPCNAALRKLNALCSATHLKKDSVAASQAPGTEEAVNLEAQLIEPDGSLNRIADSTQEAVNLEAQLIEPEVE